LNEKTTKGQPSAPQIIPLKKYEKPELARLGDVRGVTLGGTIFAVESGDKNGRNKGPGDTKIITNKNPNNNPFNVTP
jgi:hypothetical protein